MTKLDDKIEIMMWKKHHTNSRICKRKEKKKAGITQLKTNKYEGILSKGKREEQNIYKEEYNIKEEEQKIYKEGIEDIQEEEKKKK